MPLLLLKYLFHRCVNDMRVDFENTHSTTFLSSTIIDSVYRGRVELEVGAGGEPKAAFLYIVKECGFHVKLKSRS